VTADGVTEAAQFEWSDDEFPSLGLVAPAPCASRSYPPHT
jgi:hypothetical protein